MKDFPDRFVRNVERAIEQEGDRWSHAPGMILREDDDGKLVVIEHTAPGDEEMYFWDMRSRAMAIAAIEATGLRPEEVNS